MSGVAPTASAVECVAGWSHEISFDVLSMAPLFIILFTTWVASAGVAAFTSIVP